jgi:hypothetical protein
VQVVGVRVDAAIVALGLHVRTFAFAGDANVDAAAGVVAIPAVSNARLRIDAVVSASFLGAAAGIAAHPAGAHLAWIAR